MQNSTCSISGCETGIRARGYCASHYAKLNRYGDPEYIPPRTAKAISILLSGSAKCTKCNETKPLLEFSRDESRATGHRSACKECAKVSIRAWRGKNADRVSEYEKDYRESHRDELRAYASNYLPAWKFKNSDKLREYNHRRRALKAGSSSGPVDLELLWEESGGLCSICSSPIDKSLQWPDEGFASVDHIHPLSRGGAHAQENLQYTHLVCNLRKHAKVG